MKTTAITNLKAKLSEHIACVKRGEEVLVTERGKPVARIVPVAPDSVKDERTRDLVRRGALRVGRGRVRRMLASLPVCRVRERTVQRVLDEERREQS